MIYIKNFPKSGDLCPIDEYCDITGQTQHEAKQANQYIEIVGAFSLQTYKDVQIAKLEGRLSAYKLLRGRINTPYSQRTNLEMEVIEEQLKALRNESN